MQTIGILGGMSAEATGEYYRLINKGVRDRLGGHCQPEMLLCSVDFSVIEASIRAAAWDKAGAYLAEKAQRLERAGADCLFLATNTMHRVSEQIKAAIDIPFVDIFEVTAEAIKQAGISRVGLIGTYPVMTDKFYADAFAIHGIEIVTPADDDKGEINRIIFEELTKNQFTVESRRYFIDLINRLTSCPRFSQSPGLPVALSRARGERSRPPALILGCTEIKLLVQPADVPGVNLFDTTALHCDRAVEMAISSA